MDTQARISLSIFFPCFNEEGNLEKVVRDALAAAAGVAKDFEIIIIDDGSTDRTAEIADRLASEFSSVRAVHHENNVGYGRALQRGFQEAKKEWVFYTDGDGQFNLSEMHRLVSLLPKYEIVIGYRYKRQDSVVRRLSGWAWTTLTNRIFGLHLKDMDCAFKIFPRKLFDEVELVSNGALIDAEILAKAHHLGYRIGEVAVTHLPRQSGQASGGKWQTIFNAFRELLLLRQDIR